MDYYSRNQLPIITFDSVPETVERARIREALCEKPFNVVLIEVQDKLRGVVSYGDIIRAGKGSVPVNRNFTSLEGKNFMKARKIFLEKSNIHEIPVVDKKGRLTGVCARNDDLLYLEGFVE